jgi:hypothetical protein
MVLVYHAPSRYHLLAFVARSAAVVLDILCQLHDKLKELRCLAKHA